MSFISLIRLISVINPISLILALALIGTSVVPGSARATLRVPEIHTAYLPLAGISPCNSYTVHVYTSVSEPVVQVGSPVTITSVLVNDGCSAATHIEYATWIKSPAEQIAFQGFTLSDVRPQGEDRQQWVFTPTVSGEITVFTVASFLVVFDPRGVGPGMWAGAESPSIILRAR